MQSNLCDIESFMWHGAIGNSVGRRESPQKWLSLKAFTPFGQKKER